MPDQDPIAAIREACKVAATEYLGPCAFVPNSPKNNQLFDELWQVIEKHVTPLILAVTQRAETAAATERERCEGIIDNIRVIWHGIGNVAKVDAADCLLEAIAADKDGGE